MTDIFIFMNSRMGETHVENGTKGAMITNMDYMTKFTQNKDYNSY